jgi:hypothetical protein
MDISSIFNDAFDYTRKMFADLGRLIVLIVLAIIPIVNLIIVGYAAKVVKESPSLKEPPTLKDYGEMWIQGLKIVVASIIWMIVPIILIAAGFGFGAISFGLFFPISPAIIGAAIVSIVVGVVLAFVFAIILSMAIIHMIRHSSFSKAFAVGEILDIIKRVGWGKYVRWLIIVFVICLVIAAIGSIPFVGWIISLIVAPLFAVFAARSASSIYSEAVPTPTVVQAGASLLYCRNCGASLLSEAIFCPKCGQKVE